MTSQVAPPDGRGVDPGGPEAQVLGDLDRRERAQARRTEAVDDLAAEPRVGERAPGRLGVQGVRGGVVHPSAVGQRDTDDGDLAGTVS